MGLILFFDDEAAALEGRGDGHWCSITCGRDVGRNGKVGQGNFQLNSCANKKCKTHCNATTNLSLGGLRLGPEKQLQQSPNDERRCFRLL